MSTENGCYLKHVSFDVKTNGVFKSNEELINWIKDHHPLEIKDDYNYDAPYENIKIVSLSTRFNQVNISFDTRYSDISDKDIQFDVEYLVENIDDDGNYPVRGQLVVLTMVPDTFVISKKK
jgi:hypothetical protein